jgi:hypothetical protein
MGLEALGYPSWRHWVDGLGSNSLTSDHPEFKLLWELEQIASEGFFLVVFLR